MIINDFVVVYILMNVLSLGLLIPAALIGWFGGQSWKPGLSLEEQDKIARKIYLVITLLCLGLALRLFMIPLWFLTLQSLVPYVPGAMCLAGVHLLAGCWSFTATIMKFFIPLGIIYWLILNSVDRKIESSPFVKTKLTLVIILAVLVSIESFLDLNSLVSIHPRIVSCCTSLFDVPRLKALKFIRQRALVWAFLFYIFLIIEFAVNLLRSKIGKITGGISAFFAIMALIFFIFFLHTRISPLMLEAPYHQCIFCLWQGFPDIAVASLAVIAGLWLSFSCAILPDLKKYPAAFEFCAKLRKIAVTLYLSGATWVTLRYALKYFFTR